jgi:hypothetical protein
MTETHPLLRFLQHLPSNADSDLSVLKCHLLVEEVLSELIARNMKMRDFLPKARLSFVQKAALSRGLNEFPEDEWIWHAVAALNEARNALAHNLDRSVFASKLESFIQAVESKNGSPSAEVVSGPLGRFQWAAFHVYTYLAVGAHPEKNLTKRSSILGHGA